MSGFASEPVRTNERADHAAPQDGASVIGNRDDGQRHDRSQNDPPGSQSSGTRDGDNGEIEISAPQKMLSAVSGSLLTSLLGKSSMESYPKYLAAPSFHCA